MSSCLLCLKGQKFTRKQFHKQIYFYVSVFIPSTKHIYIPFVFVFSILEHYGVSYKNCPHLVGDQFDRDFLGCHD